MVLEGLEVEEHVSILYKELTKTIPMFLIYHDALRTDSDVEPV